MREEEKIRGMATVSALLALVALWGQTASGFMGPSMSKPLTLWNKNAQSGACAMPRPAGGCTTIMALAEAGGWKAMGGGRRNSLCFAPQGSFFPRTALRAGGGAGGGGGGGAVFEEEEEEGERIVGKGAEKKAAKVQAWLEDVYERVDYTAALVRAGILPEVRHSYPGSPTNPANTALGIIGGTPAARVAHHCPGFSQGICS